MMKELHSEILLLSSLFFFSIVIIILSATNRPSQKSLSYDNSPSTAKIEETGQKLKTDYESQKKPNKKQPKNTESHRRDKKSNNLPSFYEVIVRKNLFRPLGWSNTKQKPPFVLCGIVRSSSNKKALIQKKGSSEGYYVGIGDTIALGYKVKEITEKKVLLKKDNQDLVLYFSDWVPQGGEARQRLSFSTGGKPSSKLRLPEPPAVLKKILKKEGLTLEEIKRDASLREKLKRKYEP